jgi:nitroreductase
MDFLELVKRRQSVRSYDPGRAVEPEKLDRCIEALRLAPSACNAQPWKIVVVTDPELKDKVADAAEAKWMGVNNFVRQAPVLIVLVREPPNVTSKLGTVLKGRPYTIIDTGIAAAHLCLQAASDDLGTCMIGWFTESKVKQVLGIPKGKHVELLITLGYPSKEEIRQKLRKKKEEIRSFNRY